MNIKNSHLISAGIGIGAATLWASRRPPVSLRGQVVLITGGSRGLGLALARKFGHLGCRLAICARTEDQLTSAANGLRAHGFEVLAIPCDVSKRDQVDAMVSHIRQHFGTIDILVSNAGEMLVAPLENTTYADMERAMDVMFWGVVNPTLAVLPEMRARGAGRIAAVTSIGGKVSVPHLIAYSCAKSAAVAFCEGLRAEMASSGISVTTIVPGLMRTGSPVNASFKGKYSKEAAWFSIAATTPVLSMDADRAAAQIVDAIRSGVAEKVLSTPANLLTLVQGLVPGLVPNVMSLFASLLPSPTPDKSTSIRGLEIIRRQGRVLKFLTAASRDAGRHLNQAT
jgi:short-subunit dehydrogenase